MSSLDSDFVTGHMWINQRHASNAFCSFLYENMQKHAEDYNNLIAPGAARTASEGRSAGLSMCIVTGEVREGLPR